MTRSSWHWFWIILTAFAVFFCVVFAWMASPAGPALAVPLWAKGDRDAYMAYLAFANDVTGLVAYFWGFVAWLSAMGWAACELALRGRKIGGVLRVSRGGPGWSSREIEELDAKVRT